MSQISGDSLAIAKDLNARFTNIINKPRVPLYTKICETVPSDGAFEKYPMVTQLPFPKQWNDIRTPEGIRVTSVLEVDNLRYSMSVQMDTNLVNDSKAYTLNTIVDQAANRCVEFPDKLSSALVEAGANAGTKDIADPAVAFYATTHQYAGTGGNTISNKLTGTGVTLTTVQTDLFAAMAALKTMKDNEGGLINGDIPVTKENFIIQCHPNMEGVFRQVLNTSWLPLLTGASGENVLKGTADIFVDGYLTDVNDWYLHCVGMQQRPFIFQEREAMRSKLYTSENSYTHDFNDMIEILVKWRFAFAYAFFFRSIKTTN